MGMISISAKQEGKPVEIPIGEDANEILHCTIHRMKIDEIDLDPLKDCPVLKFLNIDMTRIRKIDLTPISNHYKLEQIDLGDNLLESVDLTPLSSCPRLERLSLPLNPIASIDLSPLSACKELVFLHIYQTALTSLNLEPLRGCPKLKDVQINTNPYVKRVDITPIAGLPLSVLSIEPKHVEFHGTEEREQQLKKLIKRSNRELAI